MHVGHVPRAHLPADGSTARHARATRSVELDSPLQVCEMGTLLKRLIPAGPTETVVSADMVVGWVDLGRRKTYLDSSRGLIAMTMFGQAAERVQIRRGLARVVDGLLDGNGKLMKNQAPKAISSPQQSCRLPVHGFQVEGVLFFHDQNSPVTKRRMASTAMRLADQHPPAAAGGTNAWHRPQGSGFGPLEWADQAQSRTSFGEMLSLTPVRRPSTRRPDSSRL